MSGPYLDIAAAADYLRISTRTLRRRLPAIGHFKTDVGFRFSTNDLDDYMARFHREPTRPAKVDLNLVLGPRKRREAPRA